MFQPDPQHSSRAGAAKTCLPSSQIAEGFRDRQAAYSPRKKKVNRLRRLRLPAPLPSTAGAGGRLSVRSWARSAIRSYCAAMSNIARLESAPLIKLAWRRASCARWRQRRGSFRGLVVICA
jgi:hypothetical protein